VSGLDLLEIDATDAVDVIHYFFEEDLRVTTAEEADAKSEVRSLMYREFYGTHYRYATKSSSGRGTAGGDSLPSDGFYGDVEPFDPVPRTSKPYVPPTDFDADSPLPFGGLLDAPVGEGVA